MMIVVERAADAQVIRENVAKEEAKASEQADAAQNMKDECEADLAEAMPILQKAIKALNTLSKNDITEVKSMKTPPAGVLITMETVCLMMVSNLRDHVMIKAKYSMIIGSLQRRIYWVIQSF